MSLNLSRRQALHRIAGGAALIWSGSGWPAARAVSYPQAQPHAPAAVPPIEVIGGTPRNRGRVYGRRFRDDIAQFLDREIYGAFLGGAAGRHELLAYADACGQVIREVCPLIHDEMEGMAEGTGLRLEEIILLTLHEELYHRGVLPKVGHCTALAVGPPETLAGAAFVGQTWDWMQSVAGLSRMLEWRRTEGPSVLAYTYPGLWVGAGLNGAGLALCWTSADLGNHALGARVGLPSYVLIAHLLYQESLESVLQEARRDRHAGWFTFVMADGAGNLVNIEGSPAGISIEPARGRLIRVGFGSSAMAARSGGPIPEPHARCRKLAELLDGTKGKTDRATLQEFFQDPACGISVGKATIDMMLFDTVTRHAYLSRGPEYQVDWKPFGFASA
jgi:hypothetical protein